MYIWRQNIYGDQHQQLPQFSLNPTPVSPVTPVTQDNFYSINATWDHAILYFSIQYNTLLYNSRNTKQYDTCVCKMPSFVYLVKCLLLNLPSKRRKCSATSFRAVSLCRAWKFKKSRTFQLSLKSNGGQDTHKFTHLM